MTYYVGIPDVSRYLNLDDDSDDDLVEDCIKRAQAAVENVYQRTYLVEADATHYFTVGVDTYGATLMLDDDLLSVTSITNGDGTTITTSQYTLLPRNEPRFYAIKLLGSAGIAWTYNTDPEDAIAVTGKWGWSLTPDNDIQQTTLRLAVFFYRQRSTGVDLDRPIASPDGSLILPGRLPEDVMGLMRMHPSKRVRI
jgi:hypothetical protein